MELRNYQVQLVDQVDSAWEAGTKLVLVWSDEVTTPAPSRQSDAMSSDVSRCSSSRPPEVERLVTLIGRAALVGVIVHRIESDFGDEEFIASRWGLTKSFNPLNTVVIWLQRVTRRRP